MAALSLLWRMLRVFSALQQFATAAAVVAQKWLPLLLLLCHVVLVLVCCI